MRRRVKGAAEPYVYKPLELGTSIRILELQPGEDDDLIDCELSTVDLNRAPQYEALSYTWGKMTDTRVISCSGKKLNIPVHLRDALLHIRHTSRIKYLWADAACIDQSNIPERGHQVRIMGSIYAGAERVLVWLGDDHFEYFDDRDNSLTALALKFLSLAIEEPGLPEYNPTARLRLDEFDDDLTYFLTSIAKLSHRPYFSRLWVLQEVGLGKSVVALLGNKEVDFVLILRILASLVDEDYLTMHFGIQGSTPVTFSLFPTLRKAVYGNSDDEELDFLDLLLTTQFQMASDPRDYIYALLGHPSALIKGRLIVDPDYTKCPAIIFHEVAIKLIEHTQSLRVLSAVHHSTESDLEKDYPSWVPTWSREECATPIAGGNTSSCDVSAGLLGSWYLGGSKKTIHIHGFVLDVIDEYAEPVKYWDPKLFCGRQDAWDTRPFDALDVWPVEEALNFKSRSTVLLHDALSEMSCMMAGLSMNLRGTMNLLPEIAALKLYMVERTSPKLDRDTTAFQGTRDFKADARSIHTVISASLNYLRGRKLFSTQNGLLGVGPSIARGGDICCIFFGHQKPFILRPVGSGHRLLGEAYIHGIMQGEAVVDFMLAEKYREQIFNIF
jgi:hypothetical protein